MIIKIACGVLETFMELAFSVGMFVELCGREKLRGGLAKVLAGVVLLVYIVLALHTNIILLQCLPDVLYFLMPLLCLSLCILIQEEWRRAIVWSVFVSGAILMVRLPTVLICAVIYHLSYNDSVINNHQWTSVCILCMEAVAFIGCLYKKNIISTWINKISFQRLFLFFVGFIEIAIVVYVINVDWERGYDINSLILLGALIVLLLLAVISLLLVWEYHAVIRTNHILKANESRMKVYYGLLSEEIHQKLKRNHDRRYEDEYVYNCLIREEYEKCLSYFQNKYIKDNVQAEITCTGYDMADYLIGRIVKQCVESDIKVTVEVEMRRSPIEENEFFVLLANLLDNAVEAASKCRTDRFIEIRIQEMSSMFRLYIVNSYAEEPMKDGGRLISGKNDGGNHGWGLESVKDTVKKYDGMIDILYENKRFVVDIVFMG